MALTRSLLKALGLNDEQINSIIEAHTDTIAGLKESIKTAEEKAKRFDEVEKELNELKSKGTEDYKAKYEAEHTAFENYKNEISVKEAKVAKEAAVKAYFESKGISGKNLNAAMRGASKEIAEIEVENGKIKNKTVLDDLLKGDFEVFVTKESVTGATTANPPANTGSGKMTKEQIFAISDDYERQKAIAENHELFNF